MMTGPVLNQQARRRWLVAALAPALFLATDVAYAQAGDAEDPPPASTMPAASTDAAAAGTGPVASNERVSTLDGSRSPFSGQFQSTYNGSSLNHPLAGTTPNPGHFAPPPIVVMTGTFALRYRFNETTTAGIGTGLSTETPFQGPRNTRASDPYVDIARSFTLGVLHNRLDFAAKVVTNHQYYDTYGYRQGYTILDDTYYEATDKLTLGITFDAFYNTFAAGDYNKSQQVGSQFFFIPIIEYRLNKTFNLRAECQIVEMNTRAMRSPTSYKHNEEFNRLGVGIAATKDLYFYLFAKVFPYTSRPVTSDNTLLGLNTILNLF